MDDLISRKWLMECVDEGWIKFDTEKDTNTYIHLVRDIAPSAQPEIIRCRECRYWYRMTINIGKCERVFNANCGIWDSDDYCSYAERPEVSE